ncbi:MAG: HAD family hydrolase [Cyanobacteria bacterium P01_D01_bin.36]
MATVRCQGRNFESVDAILFDKDGTLAFVEPFLRELGKVRSHLITAHTSAPDANDIKSSILRAFGLSTDRLDPAGLLAVGSRYENEIAAATCLAATGCGWIDSIERAKTAFIEAEKALSPKVEKTPLIEGVITLFEELASAGIKLGIVSSDLHTEVAAFVNYYQLGDVAWYFGAAPTHLPKTHSDFLTFACESMSVAPSKTLVIGDSAADHRLANQGAAGFLGMTGGWSEPPAIAAAATTLSNWSQVEAFN